MLSNTVRSDLSSDTCKPAPVVADNARDADLRLSLSMDDGKDIRAYEHNRQKVKKAAELAKRKARNSPGLGWSRVLQELKTHSLRTTAPSVKHERLWIEEVDSLEGLEHDPDVKRVSYSLPSRGVPRRREVKLTDLVTARKPRKGSDSDFEVIPHVRSVIVLDDCVSRDPIVDEPWEYVRRQHEEDGPTGTRSYADILSTGKL